MAVIALVASVILAGAGAAITLLAKGSGRGSHTVGAALTNTAPAGAATTSEPATTPERAVDASAKELARTAQIAALTIATDDNGSYASVTPEKLKAVEPTIVLCSASAQTACLSAAKGTETSYTVTVTAEPSGGEFTLQSTVNGDAVHTCVARSAKDTGCQNGTW